MVSDNESFIDEVTEEVRRDKLYLLIRSYGWIPLIVILAIISGSVFIEVRSSSMRIASEGLGDLLSEVLDDKIGNTDTISDNISKFVDSQSTLALILSAKVFENKSEFQSAISAYEEILKVDDVQKSIKDFVRFKLLLLVKNDPVKTEDLLAKLITPNSAFNLLALEQKVLIEIKENNWEDAIANLNLLIADQRASQAMISRATQIKKAIVSHSSSD